MYMHRIFLTGATGFTGSWLAQYMLDAGAVVTTLLVDSDAEGIFNRTGIAQRVKRVYGSILDFDLLVRTIADHGIDSVFHLAAISVVPEAYRRPRESFEVNIRGTYSLLEACRVNRDLVKKVLLASSDKVYGDSPCLPYTETLPVQGMNPYDVSKSCADLIARSYHHSFDLPVGVARFSNIYGGGDFNWSRLVPNTICRLLKGKAPLVRSPSHGVYKRDFLYIKDQVRAFRSLFDGLSRREVLGQAYNFGMGDCLAVPEVVAKIQRIMGLEQIVPSMEKGEPGEILHQQLGTEKARIELGWAPSWSIDDGLAETVDWYTQLFSQRNKSDRVEAARCVSHGTESGPNRAFVAPNII
jgi:CDP-glucose 4,6-dehydratase